MADIQNDLALLFSSQSAAVLFRGAYYWHVFFLLLKAEQFIIKNETFPGSELQQLEDFLAQ